jgi:GNAT superfamily N-acetyltransferase
VAYRIEPFDASRHETRTFSCGSPSQDNFLCRTARRQQRDGYTRLHVAIDAGDQAEPMTCLGFYAINSHAIGRSDLPADAASRSPRSGLIPAVFLSHLAVDLQHQGQGLGRILLVDALRQCQNVQQVLGIRLLLLDVSSEGGSAAMARRHRFYAALGFRPLPGHGNRLFLPLRARGSSK